MSAMSALYIELQVEAALLEVAAHAEWSDPKDVARQLIEALDERDIELRPR